jgi:hypothetical protein
MKNKNNNHKKKINNDKFIFEDIQIYIIYLTMEKR